MTELVSTQISCVEDELEYSNFTSTILNSKDDHKDKEEWETIQGLLENIVLSFANHSTIDSVEELEENKRTEDDCHMSMLVLSVLFLLTVAWSLASCCI